MYIEGKAKITSKDKAFLNPEARLTRELGISIVKSVGKGFDILDPTAATGIRGIRYSLETKPKSVTSLDINRSAFLEAKKNIKSNKAKVMVFNKSIQEFCNTTKDRFDVVDLDPFGSIAPNLYDILKVCKTNGLLFATATDTAVLCGAHRSACLRIYDAEPMHNEQGYEVGLRLLIGYIARTAAQFNFGIEVIHAMVYKHYMRVHLRILYGSTNVNESLKSMGYAYYCNNCGEHYTTLGTIPSRHSCDCGSKLSVSGRIWLGSLKDNAILKRALKSIEGSNSDMKLMNTIISEPEFPLYYAIPKITKRLLLPSVSPDKVIERLRDMGYIATRTHFEDSSVKTNAPLKAIEKSVKMLSK